MCAQITCSASSIRGLKGNVLVQLPLHIPARRDRANRPANPQPPSKIVFYASLLEAIEHRLPGPPTQLSKSRVATTTAFPRLEAFLNRSAKICVRAPASTRAAAHLTLLNTATAAAGHVCAKAWTESATASTYGPCTTAQPARAASRTL
eukprot:6191941-Pleurochrysis_carterae.AAC.7